MPLISVNSASFCELEPILEQVATQTGYEVMGDDELIRRAADKNREDISYIHTIFLNRKKPSGRLLKQRYLALAKVKTALANSLLLEKIIIHGLCSMMVPPDFSHILKVGIMADEKFRGAKMMDKTGLSRTEVQKLIAADDALLLSWADILNFGDPWDPSKYDLFIPIHKKTVQEAVTSIIKYSGSRFVRKDDRSMEKAVNFLLASKVELALASEGHEIQARAYGSEIVLTIPKNIILLGKFEEELREIASKVPGVKKVNTELSAEFYRKKTSNLNRGKSGAKLLLVDDEREFVHTLSERLLMREIGSAVVYDGEQALAYIEEENPPVIILDLKMPGIDGIEVLRRVKASHADISVIILSGHGSKEDEKKCLELGAVAYLQKPVDIDNLTSLLKKINENIQDENRIEKSEN
jgi:two-component system, OmpR family, response regulator CpxR